MAGPNPRYKRRIFSIGVEKEQNGKEEAMTILVKGFPRHYQTLIADLVKANLLIGGTVPELLKLLELYFQ